MSTTSRSAREMNGSRLGHEGEGRQRDEIAWMNDGGEAMADR